MGGLLRALAICAVAAQIVLSGCVLSTAAFIAPKESRETFYETHRVEVRSVPAGAAIRAEGQDAARSPAYIEVPYKVERVGTTYRWWTVLLAMGVMGGVYTVWLLDGGQSFPPKLDAKGLLGYAMIGDATSAAIIGPTFVRRNMNWRKRAEHRIEPVTAQVTVEWDGWAPVQAQVAAPTQPYVTVRRPSLGTFDEALITWDRQTDITPSPQGMLELGQAYERLAAKSGRPEHRERAAHFYEQHIASGEGTQLTTQEAQSRLNVLRAAEGR